MFYMEYENESLDGEVGFIEDSHTYVLKKDKAFKFTSVTAVIKNYYEEFDAVKISERIVRDKKSEYHGMDAAEVRNKWSTYAKEKSSEGTELHLYGQNLLDHYGGTNDNKDIVSTEPKAPNLPKAKHVPGIVSELLTSHTLAKTELLTYSTSTAIAGQSDIILKKKWGNDDFYSYAIYDWKFLSKKLGMTSYYNRRTRKYKMMLGMFRYLKDCNWIHYSIQLAMYQTMTGSPTLVKEKVLVVVYDDGYELVPAYPMRIFWNADYEICTVYEIYNGKVYDSRVDALLDKWPEDIKGR